MKILKTYFYDVITSVLHKTGEHMVPWVALQLFSSRAYSSDKEAKI